MPRKKWGRCIHANSEFVCGLSNVRCIDTPKEKCSYEAE